MAGGTIGAGYEADGITSGPTYAYAPPPAFFAAEAGGLADVFDIRDFGAVADPAVDNASMIQAAIQAAHDAGGGIVLIPAGTWGVGVSADGYGSIHLLDNVFLKGDGMGASSLRLMDGISQDVTGIVRTPWNEVTTNCGIADLSIDGNKANTTGLVDGFFTGPQPGSTARDADIQLLRVEIHDVSRYGFDPHEQTERLSIKDSVARDNGVDGFVLDFTTDSELTGNVSYDNGRHGFNFVTTSSDILLTDNVAHDNGGAGFVIQRGSENIPASHSITLQGGSSYANGREGVLVQMSHDVTLSGMDIHDNGRSGVRVFGSSNVTIEDNTIQNNSRSIVEGYSEVEILAYVDSVYGQVYAATDNLIQGNAIGAIGIASARYGIDERAGNTGGNIAADNDFGATVRGPLALNGLDSYAMKLGTEGNDTIVGSASQDHIVGNHGADGLSGQDGNDLIEGGAGADSLLGGKGNDRLQGGADNDLLNGNSGNDILEGESGADNLIGDAGNDSLSGGDGDDTVSGGTGDDFVLADAGNDVLNGGSGFDTLSFGNAGSGVIVDLAAKTATGATTGNDALASFEAVIGSAYADRLSGDKNANDLAGGAGDDTLRGLGGADTLTGGSGNDIFLWGAARDVVDSGVFLGRDTITDFTIGQDKLDIDGLVGSTAWSVIADIVRVTDTSAGSVVAVNIGGTFRDVVQLDGVHGTDAQDLYDAGAILV